MPRPEPIDVLSNTRPSPAGSRLPYREEWTIDTGATSPGWVLEQLEPTAKPAPSGNTLAQFAGGGGTAGEVGILHRILEIVGARNRWCCEFGASDGVEECNTIDLVRQQGWSAVYIEPGPKFAQLQAAYQDVARVHTLQRFVGFEGPELLDAILAGTPCPTDLDVMIIDVDGCDYHIWNAIDAYRARVVVVEINGTIQPDIAFVQPRDMSVRQGSSLLAMTELGRSRGYELVATTLWNAFFVERSLFGLFGMSDNSPVHLHSNPMTFSLFQLYDGHLVLGGWAKLNWMDMRLALEDIQILPKRLRRYIPGLARSDTQLLPDGTFEINDPALTGHAREQHDAGVLTTLLERLQLGSGHFLGVGNDESCRVMAVRERGWTGHLVRIAPTEDAACLPPGLELLDFPAIDFDRLLGFVGPIAAIAHRIDLLSIGVSGAEYHVWRALAWLEPAIVTVQFNPTIPNTVFFVQAADCTVHQGCSLRSLVELGRQLGYELAACSLTTAFFVPANAFPSLGCQTNDIDDMHVPQLSMRLFQLYDGTLRLAGLRRMLWHGIVIDADAIQVLPKALRRWSGALPPGAHQQLYVEVN